MLLDDVDRRELLEHAGEFMAGFCWYCGLTSVQTKLIIEHMTPRSSGGDDGPANLVAACSSCNTIKGPRDVEEFRRLLEARGASPVVFAGERLTADEQLRLLATVASRHAEGLLVALGSTLDIGALADRAGSYRSARRAESTREVYRRDWALFQRWCVGRGLDALPASPETVALFVTDLAGQGRHASTINRRLAAVASVHEDSGHDSPTKSLVVTEVTAGVRRVHGVSPRRQVAPAVTSDIRRMVEALPATLIGVRDRALLLLGFAGAFRRSELVALQVDDVTETDDGLVVTIRRSKTDQEGTGRQLGVPYGSNPATCPVRALRAWREAGGITEGALWHSIDRHGRTSGGLSPQAVAIVVKRAAARAGLDPARYAGHSLRAGLATAAAAAGASERAIMAQTGHKSLPMVRRYIRSGTLFHDNAAAQVGL